MLINIIRIFTYPLRHLYGGGRPGCCPRDNSAIVSYRPALKSSQTHGVRLKEEFLKNKVMQSYPTVKKHFSATGNVRNIRGPMYILINYLCKRDRFEPRNSFIACDKKYCLLHLILNSFWNY